MIASARPLAPVFAINAWTAASTGTSDERGLRGRLRSRSKARAGRRRISAPLNASFAAPRSALPFLQLVPDEPYYTPGDRHHHRRIAIMKDMTEPGIGAPGGAEVHA